MKYFAFCLLLLSSSLLLAGVDPNFEIGGLIVDQTLSRVGHLFYEELINGWEVPQNANIITVHERPDVIAGNIIFIEVNDDIVFQERVGTRTTGIEEKAQSARSILESYLQKSREALHDLEVY